MSEYRDQKEAKMAMTGRMGMLTGGILLLFTAISSSLTYGINFVIIAVEAAKGTEDYTEMLANANLSISATRIIGICFFVMAAAEIGAGIMSLVNCNRLDKAERSKKIILALLVLEILMQVILFLFGVPNLSLLVTSLVIPGYMLWGATRLCKLAKLYPDRVRALNTRKMREQRRKQRAAAKNPAPQKSLRERATVSRNLKWDEEPEEGNAETAGETEDAESDREISEDAESAGEAGAEAGNAKTVGEAGAEAEDAETAGETSARSISQGRADDEKNQYS